MLKRSGNREIIVLLVLFCALVGIAVFYEQIGQERQAANLPTTSNAQSDGIRGLYLLLQREGMRAEPLRTPWSVLSPEDGLLVFVEPQAQDRPITAEDLAILERWIHQGGTLLDLVSDPPIDQPLSKDNPVTGDCGAHGYISPPAEVPVNRSANSPLLRDVAALSVVTKQRLSLAAGAPYTILAQDAGGPIAVDKPLGKGHVVLIANRAGATNGNLAQADNAVFLYNVALRATAGNRTVRFDEYHQGIGFDQNQSDSDGSLWHSLPSAIRFAFVFTGILAVLIVYNGNRRFGPAHVDRPVSLKSSTDYVNSMARLYRRAGAGDVAFQILFLRFVRDLRRSLDLPIDANSTKIFQAAEKRHAQHAHELGELLYHGDAILNGQRLNERDMLQLATRIEQLRRSIQLVGV